MSNTEQTVSSQQKVTARLVVNGKTYSSTYKVPAAAASSLLTTEVLAQKAFEKLVTKMKTKGVLATTAAEGTENE